MIGLALKLGVPPQTILEMPESHFRDCLAFLSLEAKAFNNDSRS